jgi:hypothetical protein
MTEVSDFYISAEVLQLVNTVARLEAKDQERILRIVSLLMLVPASAQRHTQKLLKDLIDRDPSTMLDCVASVDEVIEYLEESVIAGGEYVASPESFYCPPLSRERN